MKYSPVKMARFKLGTVVADTTDEVVTSNGGPDIGHVAGFGVNCINEVLLKVDFAVGGVRLIHPSNITLI